MAQEASRSRVDAPRSGGGVEPPSIGQKKLWNFGSGFMISEPLRSFGSLASWCVLMLVASWVLESSFSQEVMTRAVLGCKYESPFQYR